MKASKLSKEVITPAELKAQAASILESIQEQEFARFVV